MQNASRRIDNKIDSFTPPSTEHLDNVGQNFRFRHSEEEWTYGKAQSEKWVHHLQVIDAYRLVPAKVLTEDRIRRVKCDEGKPFCARCCTTGRQCDGYAPVKRNNVPPGARNKDSHFPPVSVVIKFMHSNSLPRRIVDYPGSTTEELRSLEFFQAKTALKLSRWLAESFWKDQLPQTGYFEPSIRHSM